jgi:hypothetical protein
MLPLQQAIQFSKYSSLYDLTVPQNNLLRRINDLADFSFIHKELPDKYCLRITVTQPGVRSECSNTSC